MVLDRAWGDLCPADLCVALQNLEKITDGPVVCFRLRSWGTRRPNGPRLYTLGLSRLSLVRPGVQRGSRVRVFALPQVRPGRHAIERAPGPRAAERSSAEVTSHAVHDHYAPAGDRGRVG